MARLKKFSLLLLLQCLCAFEPAQKFLLNDYYHPNRLVFRTIPKGSFKCSLFGVVVPYVKESCIISPSARENFRKISNLAIGYMQNNLDLEQMYSVSFVDGFCVVRFRGEVLNEKIIKDGFGILSNYRGGANPALIERLSELESIASEHQLGLWKDFRNELECLRE